MATEIGKTLREARTERGIELGEVERVTKIRARLLSALEEDRWQDLPEPVYVRGFISTYAHYLDVDAEPLLERYREITGEREHPAHVPYGAVHTGDFRRSGGPRTRSIAIAAVVTAVLLVLVIAAIVGGGNGGSTAHTQHRGGKAPAVAEASGTSTAPTTTTPTSTATPAQVSVELRSTADVWVCLVDDSGNRLVNSETLPPGQTRGPFTGSGFDMTFGNGSVDLTVNGQAVKVPQLAQPLGYRITTTKTTRLQPSSQPTCV